MYSRSTGEVNSNRVTSSLLRKRTRLPTHAHEVRALTFEVTDNFGSNVVLRCGAYGPWPVLSPLRLSEINRVKLHVQACYSVFAQGWDGEETGGRSELV